jgi:hypothetical protein
MYMCWNKEVSLNTFLFSSFVFLLVLYNNEYTFYKIPEFDKFWLRIFMVIVISMQLVEYFIWKNINNIFYNKLFTHIAMLIIFFQPITTILNINNKNIKNILLFSYLVLIIPFGILNYNKNIYSTISNQKHLNWNLINHENKIAKIIKLAWLFFFLFPLFYEGQQLGFLFGLLTLFIISYNYINDNTIESMWCWIVNSIMLYYAGYLLFYLPFIQK